MFVVKYDKFNLTCAMINEWAVKIVDSIASPFGLSLQQVVDIKTKIDEYWKFKVWKVLWLPEDFDVSEILPDNIDVKNLTEDEFIDMASNWLVQKYHWDIPQNIMETIPLKLKSKIIWKKIEYKENWGHKINDNLEEQSIENKWVLGKLSQFKDEIILQILKDKRLVDQWVCGYIVEKIWERYDNAQFKFSVIILMLFLLFPFVRLFFFILWIFNFILFKLCNFFKIYGFKEIDCKVEVLE